MIPMEPGSLVMERKMLRGIKAARRETRLATTGAHRTHLNEFPDYE